MNKSLNKILIGLVFVIIISGIYLYFSNGLKSEAALSSSNNDTTVDTSSIVDPTSVSADERIASDTAFISKLTNLTSIKIDTSLFSNKLFTILNDNNVKIEVDTVGRNNPFSEIGSDTSEVAPALVPVVTDKATQITDKTAILNGTVNKTNSTANYFEYGTTEELGQITALSKLSMIGGFSSSITGLTSKTEYFFRAVSKINGVLVYGEVLSFMTN